eukprot:112004_1
MTWQAKESNRQRSQSTCSQTTFINALTNTLKQYDKDNDGYINWDEFCAMARDKQYTNYERDQLWIQLGAGKISNTNSFVRKIPIQPIMQSHTKKKFIGGNYMHVNTYMKTSYDPSSEFLVARPATSKRYQSYNNNINNINNNINIAVGKGGYGSYDTTSDRNNVCWEF